jgi:hypothetical protein
MRYSRLIASAALLAALGASGLAASAAAGEVHGRVVAVKGDRLTLRLRDGKTLSVDIAQPPAPRGPPHPPARSTPPPPAPPTTPGFCRPAVPSWSTARATLRARSTLRRSATRAPIRSSGRPTNNCSPRLRWV